MLRLPWSITALQFAEAPGDVRFLYEDELVRVVPGPNKSGRRLLYNACSAARIEWYANNIRARWSLPQDVLQLLPSGTTSNEALHAELKSFFKQTQLLHQSTLLLKLRVILLMKILPHTRALTQPTLRKCELGCCLRAWLRHRPGRLRSGASFLFPMTRLSCHYGTRTKRRKSSNELQDRMLKKSGSQDGPATKMGRRRRTVFNSLLSFVFLSQRHLLAGATIEDHTTRHICPRWWGGFKLAHELPQTSAAFGASPRRSVL